MKSCILFFSDWVATVWRTNNSLFLQKIWSLIDDRQKYRADEILDSLLRELNKLNEMNQAIKEKNFSKMEEVISRKEKLLRELREYLNKKKEEN